MKLPISTFGRLNSVHTVYSTCRNAPTVNRSVKYYMHIIGKEFLRLNLPLVKEGRKGEEKNSVAFITSSLQGWLHPKLLFYAIKL